MPKFFVMLPPHLPLEFKLFDLLPPQAHLLLSVCFVKQPSVADPNSVPTVEGEGCAQSASKITIVTEEGTNVEDE